MEQSLSFELCRSWFISYLKGSDKVALGFGRSTLLSQIMKDTLVAFINSFREGDLGKAQSNIYY